MTTVPVPFLCHLACRESAVSTVHAGAASQLTTQLALGDTNAIVPSNWIVVHSRTLSILPLICGTSSVSDTHRLGMGPTSRTSSQLGHPSRLNSWGVATNEQRRHARSFLLLADMVTAGARAG